MLTTGYLPFQPSCCGWQGACRGRLLWRGGGIAGAGPGRGPPPAAWRCATVLRLCWPTSLGRGSWCEASAHAARSVAACARGPPSSTSASTSCLIRPVLPRRLWRVVGWVEILLDMIGGVESALWEGCYRHWRWGLCDSLCLVLLCGGRDGLGGVVLLFILGSSLGGVGPVRGLRESVKTVDHWQHSHVCGRR